MGETVIEVHDAGKKFSKSLKNSMLYGGLDILSSIIGGVPDSSILRNGEFWAVNGISFELEQGDSLGIIGPNGSGKTTLLKMLNGIFMPDKGHIEVKGKVGALIQVGAGFHPMLTGRENIYINGAILGMKKQEIDEKFDSIIEFADIGDFLDAPVKHYSSGMYIRLGFAIAIHSHPDILLVDEILAVGDKDYQLKCYQKMHEIRQRGTTIIIVSHNEYTIREETERCLYLDHGAVKAFGSSEEIISDYIRDVYEKKAKSIEIERNEKKQTSSKAHINTLKFLNNQGEEVSFVDSGDELTLEIDCQINEKLKIPIFGINFYDDNGLVYCANSNYDQIQFTDNPFGHVRVRVKIPELHLPTKNYLCSVLIADERDTNLIDFQTMAYKLVVGRAKNARGSLKLKTQWELENA